LQGHILSVGEDALKEKIQISPKLVGSGDSWRKRRDKKREPLFFWGTTETVQMGSVKSFENRFSIDLDTFPPLRE
jgi:hypothetical protein